jgi:type IV pilus assembly protein PilN
MRLDINLASRPYEDARQFWMRWGTAVGVAGFITIALLTLTTTSWFNARRDHAAMRQKRTLIADRDRRRADAEKFLNQPENRDTRDTSQFLNDLIERKAFSWTRVLENLEKMMPPGVHLLSISPELDEDNQLAIKMTVAGNSRDRALELARRMEDSRRFAQTNVPSGRLMQNNTGDTEQFEIVAVYIPEPLVPPAQDATAGAKSKTNSPESKKEVARPKANSAKPTVKPRTSIPKPLAPPARGGAR